MGSGTGEKEVIRSLVIDLESRRSLQGSYDSEGEAYVAESIRWMRDRQTEALKLLVDDSDATQIVERLRDNCNAYLNQMPHVDQGSFQPLGRGSRAALGELRESFRAGLTRFGEAGVERATRLAERIPEKVQTTSPLGEESEPVDSFSPPQCSPDQERLDRLLGAVTRGVIRDLEFHDFSVPWDRDMTYPLSWFAHELNGVEEHFDDQRLEALRQELRNPVGGS